ncbi:hypothetical protein RJ641_005536 [Dillenia turbinata]|uniref:Uncharacterized protein n=1 Tax=Dillenia turbinata TaxID=194707 RepID=A0AAN8VG62_9MAGN
MRSLSGVGLGLSVVFGCLFLALLAELYYLFWWKKRISYRDVEDELNSSSRELMYMFCWKKPSSLSSTALNPQEICSSLRFGTSTNTQANEQDLVLKPFGEEAMETELMRLHNLSGPPRFLFTIKEETKEDLESEDAKSRVDKRSRGRSLSDLLLTMETPYLTPLSSPPFLTPPLTPMKNSSSPSSTFNSHGFNPLFETSTDAEFNRIRASPPPKFKFLKDAEEKLQRKLKEEAEKKAQKSEICAQDEVRGSSSTTKFGKDEENGSFITIIVAKNKERELINHSSFSQKFFPFPVMHVHLTFMINESGPSDYPPWQKS